MALTGTNEAKTPTESVRRHGRTWAAVFTTNGSVRGATYIPLMPGPMSEDARQLVNGLPPGRLVGPCRDPHPVVWMSDGPVAHAADWWKRLYARRLESGLYPILLEYPDDSFEPAGGGHGADIDAASYLRSRWTDDSWPSFQEWPGLARPAVTSTDVDACAGEVASAVARDGRARCLALVQVSRGADAPAAVGWSGMSNHMTARELSAVLRSWEDRFGLRVVGLTS